MTFCCKKMEENCAILLGAAKAPGAPTKFRFGNGEVVAAEKLYPTAKVWTQAAVGLGSCPHCRVSISLDLMAALMNAVA